jgi:hypothetical protein
MLNIDIHKTRMLLAVEESQGVSIAAKNLILLSRQLAR